jgi:hypothetical protein
MGTARKVKEKEKTMPAHCTYWHECEPVIQMLCTAGRVVAWGVMPLFGRWALLVKLSPILGRWDGGLFIFKFPFVEYEVG